MKIRYSIPKYSRVLSGLMVLGGVMLVSKGIGMLVLAAAMSAFVVGMVAELREWEAKHKADENP